MKKILIFFIAMMVIGGVAQKIVGNKNVFQSMDTARKDNDPNSSTRKLAKQYNNSIAKYEADKKQTEATWDSELDRRLKALGEASVQPKARETLIYLFNDSRSDVVFSVERQDRSKYAPDIPVRAGRYEKLAVKDLYRAFVGVNGEREKWLVGDNPSRPESRFSNIFGCFYK